MSNRPSRNPSSKRIIKKKVNLNDIKVETWMKPDRLIWVEVMNQKGTEPCGYLPALIKEVLKKEKKIIPIYIKQEIPELDESNQNKAKKPEEVEEDKLLHIEQPEEVYANRVMERSEIPQVLEDLVDIDPLNDAELMKCLELRYRDDEIYCFVGPTLISINPYKGIPKYQDIKWEKMFRNYSLYGGKNIPYPHIFNITSRAFYQLFDNKQKQAICISGESGAGKTYGTRECMRFLTSIFDDIDPPKLAEDSISDKINGCNPIMEAFGNAKTVMNNDSSRFGKYFELLVDRGDKHIKGARIKTYLLEKSRVVTQGISERSYHIFYGIMKYMGDDEQVEYLFRDIGKPETDMSKFNYVNKSGCYEVLWDKKNPDKDEDIKFYNKVVEGFDTLGFSEVEKVAIWKLLSAVLNLGNLKIDSSTFDEGSTPCKLVENKPLKSVLKLLGTSYDNLNFNICSKVTDNKVTGRYETPIPPVKCKNTIDAFAKELFNKLFSWIIKKLNLNLLPDDTSNYTSIGLLDIFGFEDFTVNSLEQFCINYTNEKLQNLYISYVFKAEAVIFEEEGLKKFIELIQYEDNQPILDLMDKKKVFGIFILLDNATMMATDDEEKNDKRLMDNIRNNHKAKKNFSAPRLNPNIFAIDHTAKKVEYTINGFVEKNKDELPANLIEAVSKMDREIYKIFEEKMTHDEVKEVKVKDPKEKFLGYKFRTEMKTLMDELLCCECNFIRCIKPNSIQYPDRWIPRLALKQIKYLGVLETIKVRRDSFPIRKKFIDFYEKYQDLDEKSQERKISFVKLRDRSELNWRRLAQNIVTSVKGDTTQVLEGKTRIFMSVDFQNHLLELLEEKQKGKREAMRKLAESVKAYVFSVNWEECRKTKVKVCHLSKNLLNTWNSKIEYIKYKKFLSVVKRMQMNYKMTLYKRGIRHKKFSTTVIARSFQLYKIRKMLFNAKKIMLAVSKCQRVMMFRLFMVRVKINKKILGEIFDRAWVQIQAKFKINSSRTIQRIWRGYFARIKCNEEVMRLKIIREDHLNNRAATKIQKCAKGFFVRNRLGRMNRAAGFIQGHMRMQYLTTHFQILRKAVRTIQRIMKMYMVKNKVIKWKMEKYFSENKNSMEQLRALEYSVLFRSLDKFFNLENLENFTRVKFFEGDVSFRRSIPNIETFIPNLPIIDLNPRMRMFSMILDFDCQTDTSDCYSQSWSVDFLKFLEMTKQNNTRLMCLEVGHSFSLAVTDELKIYNWGLNDNRQLAKGITSLEGHNPPSLCKTLSGLSPRLISSGDDHTIMLDYKNDVYIWGDNKKGQLGLGHPRKINSVVKMTSLGKNLKTAAARGKQTFVVTGDGNILKWPNKQYHCKFCPMMVKSNDPWIKFDNISCGEDFAIALTTNGLLFSYGDNLYGQLGQGDKRNREIFTMVEKLKDLGEKTIEVSCGHKHAICRTANGKIYSWGMGTYGQLGSGDTKHHYLPYLVHLSDDIKLKTLKAISAQAGYNSSYVLYEDHKVYMTGKSAKKHSNNLVFKQVFLKKKHQLNKPKSNMDFIPIKLYTSWSKSISICYIMMGDFRSVKRTTKVRYEIVKHINKKWLSCYNQIMPPYDKSIAKHISSKYIKKIHLVPKRLLHQTEITKEMKENYRNNLLRSRTPVKRKKRNISTTPIKKKKKVKKNRNKTPTLSRNRTPMRTPVRTPAQKKKDRTPRKSRIKTPINKRKSTYMKKATFEERKQKMKKLKSQLQKLMTIPQNEWTEEDRKLIEVVRNYEYLE